MKTIKRVNFDKSLKMHLACGDYDFTEYIYFKNGFAYATIGIRDIIKVERDEEI